MTEETVCTALPDAQGNRPDFHGTPPCACPACVPDPVTLRRRDRERRRLWLRVEGRPVRFDIAPLTLGDEASELL